jgi:hypothetical protein
VVRVTNNIWVDCIVLASPLLVGMLVYLIRRGNVWGDHLHTPRPLITHEQAMTLCDRMAADTLPQGEGEWVRLRDMRIIEEARFR